MTPPSIIKGAASLAIRTNRMAGSIHRRRKTFRGAIQQAAMQIGFGSESGGVNEPFLVIASIFMRSLYLGLAIRMDS